MSAPALETTEHVQTTHSDVNHSTSPEINDLSAESITQNVHAVNSNCPDERTRFVFKALVQHMHDFIRETSLTTEEWMKAIRFSTETGKKSDESRQEFSLLSDVLGVSMLVDAINNVHRSGTTESSVLGPFYASDAHELTKGASIASEGKGEYMYVEGKVRDTQGRAIQGAVIDTWETDGFGNYDTQYENRENPDCRGRFRTSEDGSYAFRAVVPVPYPIPTDGPVGDLLSILGRHPFRPAHLHMVIEAEGYEKLITALYFKNDPYISSDIVFGVKSSLIVDPERVSDSEITRARGFEDGSKEHLYVKYDFVLATTKEGEEAVQKAKTNKQMGEGEKRE